LSNLAARIGTAIVVLPLLLAAFFLGPPWLGAGIVSLACLVALQEFFTLVKGRGFQPLPAVGVLVMALVFVEVARVGHRPWPPAMPVVMMVAVGAAAVGRVGTLADRLAAVALTLLGALYLGALGGCMAALLLIPPVRSGPGRVAFLMAVIMISDTAALFVGRAWGRHKLAPNVSPGKTVEGAVGAVVGGIPSALLVRAFAFPEMPIAHAVALGAVIAVVGIVGDLGESLMKRWAGVKDSGTLFPGHGGMLDRLDSLLFGAPVLYYYFLLVP
jgi:phosphatidate cytidylyltransferase